MGPLEASEVELTFPLRLDQPGLDIPPQGSSAFDKVFFDPALKRYQIPFPLNKMIDHVGALTQQPINVAFFPVSRSLQRPTDESYHPFDYPRIVLSVGATNNILLRNKFFWAYLEPKDQLEVISYNEELGRFEFQVVKNYSSPNPQVLYAPRAKCLSCHQSHSPILSVSPWNDSASEGNFFRRLLVARHFAADKFTPELSEKLTQKIVGKTDQVRESVALVDANVRAAEGLINFQRAYVFGCQTRECRLRLLKLQLNLCEASTPSGAKSTTECGRHDHWADQIESLDWWMASSQISSGLLSFKVEDQLRAIDYNGPYRLDLAWDFMAKDGFVNSLVEHLRNLDARDNPATSRIGPPQEVRSRVSLLDQFQYNYFGREKSSFFNMLDSDKHLPLKQSRVYRALHALYEANSPIFDARPIDIRELISAVERLNGLETSEYQNLPAFDIRDHAKLLNETIPTFFSSEPLNAMLRHCGQCHQSSQSYPPPFLNGPEEVVVNTIKKNILKIRQRIELEQMPPLKPLQESFQGSKDRKLILNWLSELSE